VHVKVRNLSAGDQSSVHVDVSDVGQLELYPLYLSADQPVPSR
jgi:hypothetical protein